MTRGLKTIIYPVRDLDKARKLYTRLLGVAPYADQPYYVGFRTGGQELGLDPNGHNHGMSGPLAYWHVEDIGTSVRELLQAGAETAGDIRDVGGGRLVASVRDADGNLIGLIQEVRGNTGHGIRDTE